MADDKPAPKMVDKTLFARTSPAIREMNRQARRELRDKRRRAYKDQFLNGSST